MKKILSVLILLVGTYFLLSSNVFAQTTGVIGGRYSCDLAHIEANQTTGQNWDVTYCIAADTPQQLARITQVTATCREAPLSDSNIIGDVTQRQNCSCYYDNNMKFDPFQDPIKNALWAACTAAAGLSSPKPAESTTQSLPPDSPVLFDPEANKYYTCFTLVNLDRNMGVIETQFKDANGNTYCERIKTDVLPGNYNMFEYFDNTLEDRLGIDIITDPTERSAKDLFCSTITGKGSGADNPGIINIITGVTNPAINTALGCIATDPEGFTKDYLTLALGIGGPVGLLLMLYGFFLIATSKGDPARIQQGQQIISSVVQGLTIIALSVVLLNFLGINVLGLPGLS